MSGHSAPQLLTLVFIISLISSDQEGDSSGGRIRKKPVVLMIRDQGPNELPGSGHYDSTH